MIAQELNLWIESVLLIEYPFKRASLEYLGGEYSEIIVSTPNGIVPIGKNHPTVVVAGPCSVENKTMIVETAKQIKASGAKFLRGGAYKPRTSPYAFQGYGESALELLSIAKQETGLGIITEVMDAGDLDKIKEVADIIQIGARNMQNFSLLRKVGSQDKPILLKRGIAATINEWLMAAEYILAAAMATAAVAAGTDSLMIEVHPNPAKALSDGIQSLTPVKFNNLMHKIFVIDQTIHKLA